MALVVPVGWLMLRSSMTTARAYRLGVEIVLPAHAADGAAVVTVRTACSAVCCTHGAVLVAEKLFVTHPVRRSPPSRSPSGTGSA